MSMRGQLYEDRYLAFIDILGFRNFVDKSERDQSSPGELMRVLEAIKDPISVPGQPVPTLSVEGLQMASFSDTICFSAFASPTALGQVLLRSAFTALYMLSLGYPVRGAVTRGRLVHRSNVIFGPCMNRAYDLESRVAIYPRIVLDPQLELPRTFRRLKWVRKDKDGIEYVGIFQRHLLMAFSLLTHGTTDKAGEIAAAFSRQIATLVKRAPDEAAKQKLFWLRSSYN